ncbi:hypothetical protein MUP59_08470 [Candidatus Bathyarchaeota archaeon]|nr:hypothetical protein [Candidatus Bathyarchaeota archaeon]
MVAKSRRRVHGRVSRHVEPVEVEEVEVEETEELEDEEELEDDVEELEDDVEDDQEEEEEEVTPRKARRFQKPAPKVVTKPALKSKVAALPPVKAVAKGKEPVTDELVDEEVKPVGIKAAPVQVAESILVGLLESLEAGKAIVITKINEKKWQVTSTEVLKSVGKLRGKEYWDKVRNPEYDAWRLAWREKSFEEKKAYAKKLGVKWVAHANPRIEEMHVTQAVREQEGISKYNPEYASRSARAALRG